MQGKDMKKRCSVCLSAFFFSLYSEFVCSDVSTLYPPKTQNGLKKSHLGATVVPTHASRADRLPVYNSVTM